jgi:hypothetical protein
MLAPSKHPSRFQSMRMALLSSSACVWLRPAGYAVCYAVRPSGFDVLIQMKNIFGIVASFDLHQSIIVGAVSRGDAVTLFRGHKVYISAGRRLGRAGFKKLPRPPYALLVILRFIPSPVHV